MVWACSKCSLDQKVNMCLSHDISVLKCMWMIVFPTLQWISNTIYYLICGCGVAIQGRSGRRREAEQGGKVCLRQSREVAQARWKYFWHSIFPAIRHWKSQYLHLFTEPHEIHAEGSVSFCRFLCNVVKSDSWWCQV